MKKLLFLAMLLVSTSCFAGGDVIPMNQRGPYTWGKPHKSPAQPPVVSYQEQALDILAPCAIEEATITIRDAEGNIIYNVCTSLPDSSYVIPLPADVCADRYSIELDYNGLSFIGYFD